jgi:16S rRNA (guanine1207-N2)-methyltransferase
MASHSHYFDREPAAESRPATVDLVLPDLRLALHTDRGVFAAAGVDPGTKYLLLEGPRPPAGAVHLLDVGCGYGPVALTLAARAPDATVWAIDVNERARALCTANAQLAGLANVRTVAPDDVPPDVLFDGVWSNPPIRIGKTALHELLATWLARMHDEAHAALVVQKHLGSDSLADWLRGCGWHVERLGSRRGYRLLDVSRGAR